MDNGSRFRMVEVAFVALIIVFFAGILIPAYSSYTVGCIKISEKNLIRRICLGVTLYEADLRVFPPDRGDLEVNAMNPTPTRSAYSVGLLNETISDYGNDNLLRHLDGNIDNDGDTGLQDFVTSRPLDCYIDLTLNEIDYTNIMKPKIVTFSGTNLYYNEFSSERRTKGFQKKHPKVEQSIIFFDSFQIYCEAIHPKNKTKIWLTNFRDD